MSDHDQHPLPPAADSSLGAQEFMESCPAKAAMAGLMGFGMGGLFGMFMGSIDFSSGSEHAGKRLGQQVALGYRDMLARAYQGARGFGKFGLLYSATECLVESFRAKSDIYNSVAAGCITGAMLAGKAGPIPAAGGCASVAAFSAAIDRYMQDRE